MDTFDKNIQDFNSNGYIQLENIFDPSFLQKIKDSFLSANSSLFELGNLKDPSRRSLISVEVKGAINTSEFLLNPTIINYVEKIISKLFVIESILAPVTGPGSKLQHSHNDGGYTYNNPKLNLLLPAHAIGVMIPLVDMNLETGTTRIWPKSHTMPGQLEYIDPIVLLGSCLVLDTRVIHAGTSNISSTIRPMIYITYSYPWYINFLDFRHMPCFSMADDELVKWDKEKRNIFVRRNIKAGIQF